MATATILAYSALASAAVGAGSAAYSIYNQATTPKPQLPKQAPIPKPKQQQVGPQDINSMKQQNKNAGLKGGYASTLLTGPSGVSPDAMNLGGGAKTKQGTLLGG